jgi:phosphoribosylamine--glycine ligase
MPYEHAAVIGKSARLDCVAHAMRQSSRVKKLSIMSDIAVPGFASDTLFVGKTDDPQQVTEFVEATRPDFAFIGPEEPLAEGIVDLLLSRGIPCVGPTQKLARLETSKSFTRDLLKNHGIPGNPEHRIFRSMLGIAEYMRKLRTFVIKPDGLTGGKGVKVLGEHLATLNDALAYCEELFGADEQAVVIEELLEGEEFSFQSFFDGKHALHMIPVQDHKRAREGDQGPNTGGMGSFSCEDHLLPFLTEQDILQAGEINRRVGEALLKETGQEYKGIIYGGFMLTKSGLRVIEFNARFGDPEVMNILPIMEGDFVDVCQAIIEGSLNKLQVRFRRQATVCKYVVPQNYPTGPFTAAEIKVSLPPDDRCKMFFGAVEDKSGSYWLTGSRAIAFLGIGDTLAQAEEIAERAASSVEGPVYHRQDIGTATLVQKRVERMRRVRSGTAPDGLRAPATPPISRRAVAGR